MINTTKRKYLTKTFVYTVIALVHTHLPHLLRTSTRQHKLVGMNHALAHGYKADVTQYRVVYHGAQLVAQGTASSVVTLSGHTTLHNNTLYLY